MALHTTCPIYHVRWKLGIHQLNSLSLWLMVANLVYIRQITQVHVHVTNIPTNYAMQWQKIINLSPNFYVKTISCNPKHGRAPEITTSTLYLG